MSSSASQIPETTPDDGNPPPLPEWAQRVLSPVYSAGRSFKFWTVVLLSIGAWSLYAYWLQLTRGLEVTGLNRPVYWGFYISNYVFFIGISQAGILLSAILRIWGADWRRPIMRAAEGLTLVAMAFGVINIVFDLGRPERSHFMMIHGNIESPLFWDSIAISVFSLVSIAYIYLAMIPDLAYIRDRYPHVRWLYGLLALNWKGTERQKRILDRILYGMALLILPVAVTFDTVVSWVFSLTIQPMWHTAIFAPIFVIGAFFSGLAALLLVLALLRKVYHLEGIIRPRHFDYIGRLLLVLTLIWGYFQFTENLTSYYGNEPIHIAILNAKLTGAYAYAFWGSVVGCFIVPILVLSRKKTRNVNGSLIASVAILIGMWLERYTIVIPTLVNPRMAYDRGFYDPTWVEWSLFAGCTAFFIYAYMLYTKFVPIVSLWELEEGIRAGVNEIEDETGIERGLGFGLGEDLDGPSYDTLDETVYAGKRGK